MDRSDESAFAALFLAAITLASYLALLRWDQQKDVDSSGNMSGPYQWWQVAGLAFVLAAAAATAGWRRHVWAPMLVIPLVLTLCWSVDAATDQNADGLWPIGAVLIAGGSVIGIGLVAGLAAAMRNRLGKRVK